MATRSTAPKAAPVEEPDEDEFEEMEESDDDLEELEEDEVVEEKPKPKRASKSAAAKAPARPTIQYGSAWLAAYITENTDETYDGRAIRMLLRKLAKDAVFQREVGVTRDRYEFTGPNDPIVKAVLKMVSSGEAKAMKQAGIDKLKALGEKKKAEKAEKAAAEKVAEDVEDEMEDAEEDEDVEEAPAKPVTRRRTAAPKTAAPAKATPAKAAPARRRAPAKA